MQLGFIMCLDLTNYTWTFFFLLFVCLFVCFIRNYHVFYYLLAGASEEERTAFHLKKPEEYHYLSQVRLPSYR